MGNPQTITIEDELRDQLVSAFSTMPDPCSVKVEHDVPVRKAGETYTVARVELNGAAVFVLKDNDGIFRWGYTKDWECGKKPIYASKSDMLEALNAEGTYAHSWLTAFMVMYAAMSPDLALDAEEPECADKATIDLALKVKMFGVEHATLSSCAKPQYLN